MNDEKLNAMKIAWIKNRIAEKGIPKPLYPWEPWEALDMVIAHARGEKTPTRAEAQKRVREVLIHFVPEMCHARLRGKPSIAEALADDTLLRKVISALGERMGLRDLAAAAADLDEIPPVMFNVPFMAESLHRIAPVGTLNIFDIDARLGEGLLSAVALKYLRDVDVHYTGVAATPEIARGLSAMGRFFRVPATVYPAGKDGKVSPDEIRKYAHEMNCFIFVTGREGAEIFLPDHTPAVPTQASYTARVYETLRAAEEKAPVGAAFFVAAQDYTAAGEKILISEALKNALNKEIEDGKWAPDSKAEKKEGVCVFTGRWKNGEEK